MMGFLLETLIGGLMSGMLYSLVALGFVLIFKASGVFNFAQGAMVLFAALAMARDEIVTVVFDLFRRNGYDAVSIADISAATNFVNAAHCGMVPDAAKYPKLTAYLAAILGRPSFAACIAREKKILGL